MNFNEMLRALMTEVIDDRTLFYVCAKNGSVVSGNWYEDQIICLYDKAVDFFSYDPDRNALTVTVKDLSKEKKEAE